MEMSMTTRLSDIVAALDTYIGHLRKLGLKQSALLMDMTKLDLQMRIHDITEVELDALCKAIERQDDDTVQASPHPAPLPGTNTATGTVISLFGGGRFPAGTRPASENASAQSSIRGERRVRGKTLVPR